MTDIIYNTKECPLNKGFYLIAGFERYAVNTDGVLIQRLPKKELNWHVVPGNRKINSKGGYVGRNLTNDNGSTHHVTRHRLLALTFKKLPPNYHRKVVNHKDGIPGNDWLDNLEWATYSENTKHAYRNGLYPNKVRPVEVFFPDGTIKVYSLRIEAIEATGLPEANVDTRLRRRDGRVMQDGYGFRYVDSDISWHCQLKGGAKEIPFWIKHLKTGQVLRFRDAHVTAEYIGSSVRTVRESTAKKHPIVGAYQIKREPAKPWNVYTEDEVELLLNTAPNKRNLVL